MSLPATVENLPTCKGREKFTISVISEYLSDSDIKKVKSDVLSHGFYLANPENKDHENLTFEELKKKFKLLLDGSIEKRKNSWVNSVRRHMKNNDDRAIASLIASLWRRFVGEMSLKKAQLSQYGYEMNGKKQAKIYKKREAEILCEWCNAVITIPANQGFICPHCGVYFHDSKTKKAKINYTTHEFSYEENYLDEINIIEKIKRGEISLEKTNFSLGAQPTLL